MNQDNEITDSEYQRYKNFLFIQIIFLLVSPFAGGFKFKIWSMLDSALLVASLGFTGLAFALETKKLRKKSFNIAIILYMVGVLDICLNIILSGWIGWGKFID